MMYFFLALYSNNFFSLANYILILMLLYEIVFQRKGKLLRIQSICFVWLFASSIFYFILSVYNGIEYSMSTLSLRVIAPTVLFYLGYSAASKGYAYVKKSIIIIMFATFLHGFMNILKNRGVDVLTLSGRFYNDIYGGTVSATVQNLFFIMSSALLFYFIKYEKQKWLKIAGILAAIGGAYGSIANASRTELLVIAFVFFACIVLHIMLSGNVVAGAMKALLVVCISAMIILFIMWMDIFGILEWYASTPLGRRKITSTVSDNLRWKYAGDIIKLLPQYPLGNMDYPHYAHNFWLDVGRETGVIPFFGYVLFYIGSVVTNVKYCIRNKNTPEKVILFSSLIMSFTFSFMSEPFMEAAPILFSIYCYVIGAECHLKNIDHN